MVFGAWFRRARARSFVFGWDEWVDSVDRDIAQELAGSPYRGGLPTWNESWLLRLVAVSREPDGAARVRQVIAARRAAGLPELTGYVWNGEGPLFLDHTENQWAAFRSHVDAAVAAERAGEPPPGAGNATWPEEWETRAARVRETMVPSAHERYLAYLADRRPPSP